jgi:hypothetical protein
MSKLDSFDNNKIKCCSCKKYFELNPKICNEYFDKNLLDLCCKKCWIEKINRFNRQTGKSALSYNLRYRPELFQNKENEQT